RGPTQPSQGDGMRQFQRFLLCVVLLTCAGTVVPTASATDTPPYTHTGTLQGAPYRIDVPADWNGNLVMLMHGYVPARAPRATPMKPADEAAIFLKQGYAVAQSAYASQGWAVGDAIADNERLRQFVERSIGRPHHTYLVGFSLGALEGAASLERHPHTYAGALFMCGATVSTPELISRGSLTPLVAFDALIPGVLPDLASPDSPAFVPPTVFAQALKAHPEQAAILERRPGGMPVDNRKTVYRGFGDDAAFNRRVHRYAGSPAALAYARRNVSLTGRIDVPLVMEWNAFDQTIPTRLHVVYPNQVRAAGNDRLLTVLPPVGQGHCAFSDAQIDAAFGTLLSKVGAAGH